MSRGFDPADAVGLLNEINNLVLNCLNDCGESERTTIPSTQRTDVDMSQGFLRRARGRGQRGVRTGGHGNSRHFRMSQNMPGSSAAVDEENMNSDDNIDIDALIDNYEIEPEMQNPSASDPCSWFPTRSDAPQSSWVTPTDRSGLTWQPTTQDSFFPDVHFMQPAVEEEDDDVEEDDDDVEEEDDDDVEGSAQLERPRSSVYIARPERSAYNPPRRSIQLDRPSSSADTSRRDKEPSRPSLTRTIMGMFPRRRSSRDNKGKGPSKFTPSSFK